MTVASAAASVSSASSSKSSSSTSTAATNSLMSNYDTFLTLLTTQLKTQSPLDPMDSSTFTNQLVQYSSVEQAILSNQKLDSMLTTLATNSALQLVNYIGKSVTAYSDTTKFQDGKCSWSLDASAAAKDAKVTITDSSGNVVYSGTANLNSGDNAYTWDGKGSDGTDYSTSTDTFTISVSGTDSKGAAISVTSQVSGKVNAIDTSGTQPYLKINGVSVPLSSVISIDG
jgi:flagellar basal-body rod modification protein FlgD